ncbi:hypothetical protein TorRG33x02_336200 [Trema orientale]|uniref:Uncharacterized protein n=1 Tax=Trema orientale TaxID=63057 RepID=A0A2P5B0H7_TREOI|nr:hypothetical protein TorRG33x02_336200 [Trema orientale]
MAKSHTLCSARQPAVILVRGKFSVLVSLLVLSSSACMRLYTQKMILCSSYEDLFEIHSLILTVYSCIRRGLNGYDENRFLSSCEFLLFKYHLDHPFMYTEGLNDYDVSFIQ